jgi:glycosyltransferase involved in cell wall biosynthesis
MNVGYAISAFYPVNGGTESYFLDLAKFISKYHKVRVYTTDVKSGDNFRIIKSSSDIITTKHHMIGNIEVFRSKITQLPFIEGKAFIEKYTKSYRENQSNQGILKRQLTVFFNWGFSFGMCRHLLYDHLDILHFTPLPLLHTYSDGFISRLRKIPSVFFPSFHKGSDHEAFFNRVPFQLATKVVVHGNDEKQDIQRLFRVPDHKIEIIPSPLDINLYSPKIHQNYFPELSDRLDIPKVLFIGRLTHTKGFIFLAETMVDLWNKGFNADFIYVGIPTVESNLIEPLLKKHAKHSFHYQNISHEAKVQLLRICDVVVLPSIVDSWGLVFFEGWSQKKPVIGVKGQCYGREFLKDGINGFTVPFLNKEILGNRLKTLLDDKTLSAKLGASGYRLLMEKYTLDSIFPKYLQLYEEIARK